MIARRVSALVLAALLAGTGAASAATGQPVRQERLLTGASTEGASVTAERVGGAIRRIRVEALDETGYTLSSFLFGAAGLTEARVRRYGYQGYPNPVASGPPHRAGIVDRTDVLLSDEQLRFSDKRLTGFSADRRAVAPGSANAQARKAEILRTAAEYLAFMNTPAPDGTADGEAWSCVSRSEDRCTTFRPEAP